MAMKRFGILLRKVVAERILTTLQEMVMMELQRIPSITHQVK